MVDLDDPNTYHKVDIADMRRQISELPQECIKSWQQAMDFQLPPVFDTVDNLLILGIGGSAIAGDLLSALVSNESKVQVSVHRDYDLPSHVTSNTLVIASSYSGTTEEILSSFTQALYTPAKKLVLTTGGKLKALAEENGVSVFNINYVAQPRAAVAHSFLPVLGICQKLGFVSDKQSELMETVQVLENLHNNVNDKCVTSTNTAKQMAVNLFNHTVVVYSTGILAPVAKRWKTQINENSKAWAFYEEFPELNHNAIVGYEHPDELARRTFVVLLRSKHLHPRNLIRYDATADLLRQTNVNCQILDGFGESALSQMMSLVLFGDWVSYYLAILYRVDPSAVKAIDYIKKRLRATQRRE